MVYRDTTTQKGTIIIFEEQQGAHELHKAFPRKLERRKIYSSYRGHICVLNLQTNNDCCNLLLIFTANMRASFC